MAVRKIIRAVYYVGMVLVFVVVAIAGFTQTRAFKSYLLSQILAAADSSLNGQLSIGRLEGNLITGIQFFDVHVTERGQPLFSAERVEATYDPLGIPLSRFPLSRVTVFHPEIFIWRSLDGTWNTDRLVRATETDTARTLWTIDIRQLRVENAKVRIIDSVTLAHRSGPAIPDSVIDYADLTLSPVSLLASAEISPTSTMVSIEEGQWTLQKPLLRVDRFAGTLRLDASSSAIQGLHIETEHSQLLLDASVETDITKISDIRQLEKVPVRLDLRGDRLGLRELRQYVYPGIEFLDGDVSLVAQVHGPFGLLSVDRVSVRTTRSSMELRGSISNLHHIEKLVLDLEGGENVLNHADIQSHLPGVTLPDWSRFGDTRLYASFRGTPKNFSAHVYASTERGTVDVDGAINIGELVKYDAIVTTRDFDLGGLVGDGTEVSRLTGKVTVIGSGTELGTIIAVAKAEFDSSSVYEIPIGKTVIVVDAAEGNVTAHVSTVSGAGSANLSGRARLGPKRSFTYALKGDLREFNVSRLPGLRDFVSDLNCALTAGGYVNAGGRRMDTVDVQFDRSSIAGKEWESGHLTASYAGLDSVRRRFTLLSPAVDLAVDGTFSPTSVIEALSHGFTLIDEYVTAYAASLDSLRGFSDVRRVHIPRPTLGPPSFDHIDARMNFTMRDARVLGVLIKREMTGDLAGTLDVVGTPEDLQMSGSMKGGVVNVQDSSATILALGVAVDFYGDGLVGSTLLQSFAGTLSAQAAHLYVNDVYFGEPNVRIETVGDIGTFEVSGDIDSTVNLNGYGRLVFHDQLIDVRFDELRLDINSYAVSATDSLTMVIGTDGYKFNYASLATEAELFTVAGFFSPRGVSDVSVTVQDFLAGNLKPLLRRTSYAEFVSNIGGIVNATFSLRGTLDHPNVSLELGAEGVRLQETVYGRVDFRTAYFEQKLNLFVRLQSARDEVRARPDLLLTGSVPFNFTLKGPTPTEQLEGQVDLEMVSQGLELRFLEPFVMNVARAIRGTLTCNVKISGSVRDPVYQGSATIRDARFLFMPTRIEYLLNGDLLPIGDRIELKNFVLENTDADFDNGRMSVFGSLTLSGITMKRFDLGFSGQLLVMKEDSSRLQGGKIFGNLTAATGTTGLRWQGDWKHSLLSGSMQVRNAQLTLPPEREIQRYSVRLIDVIYDRDSTNYSARLALDPINGDSVSGPPVVAEEAPRSFLDGIDYDLGIETAGPTQVKFIFNRQTNDVLFADVRGHMSFQKTSFATRLTGEVEVTDRSYYNFLKRFTATGKIYFTGDPLNPELDITAKYEGVHRKMLNPNSESPKAVNENVTVILYLRGPRNKLETRFDVEVQTTSGPVKRTGDVEADAIAFIMTNQFRDELTEQQRTSLIGENLGYGLATGMLTGPISEMLRRYSSGTIQSFDVNYYSGSQSGTDIRVTGEFRGAIIRVGGRIFNDPLNSNLIVEVPLSRILDSDRLRNLYLTLERRSSSVENTEDRGKASNGARLLYRFTF